MIRDRLRELYEGRERPRDEIDRALAALEAYERFLGERGRTVERATEADVRAWLGALESADACTVPEMLALARAHYVAGNNEVYVYFTQVLERSNIITNLRSHMESVLGPERAGRVFDQAEAPAPGAPPEAALPFTRRLVESLEAETDGTLTADALRANAHGLRAEMFAGERERFLESATLAEYLRGAHERSVATLAEHARSGAVWMEQVITDEVVDLVRGNEEILGGKLDGRVVFWTKIPYKPTEWLAETNPERRRYLACHCPMAREALATPGGRFPRVWCNCTAGFVQQRFNAVFGEETTVELLESVLDGDDRCRFAIRVPDGVHARFAKADA